jgi:hypothetical protein
MTTHDMQPTDAPVDSERTFDAEPSLEAQPPLESTPPAEPSVESTAPAQPPVAEHHDVEALFGDADLTDLKARWTDVQSAFVDDPRDCVQKADGLVADVVERLTSSFAQARSHLEDQWAKGEEASTEDLRVALKQYREFFERLLAV